MQYGLGKLVAVAIIAIGVAAPVWAETAGRQISVTGEGRVDAQPDMATVSLGVTNEAAEAQDAMAQTSEAVARILKRLGDMGIETRDVQTQRLSLNPVWSNRSSSGSGRAEITGFSASNTVLVRVRDLDHLGSVLDSVISDGANDLNGLSFGVQKPDPLQDEARTRAVKDAMAKAQLLADAAGITLGPVVSISEHGGGGGPRPMMMEMAAARDASVPVAAGEVSLAASVSMVFEIAD